MDKIMMKLQDERNAIIRSYKRREIHSKDACRLLRENDIKKKLARRGQPVKLAFAEG